MIRPLRISLAGMFKKIRIALLLYILLMVGVGAWLTAARSTDWDDTLWVTVYPINGDGSEAATQYIASLNEDTFTDIEVFMQREGERFGVALARPVNMKLGAILSEAPPAPPRGGNTLQIAWWSLKLRYWAYRVDSNHGRWPADIQVFVLYYDPATHARVADSLGLQKGLIGVVHAFASRRMTGSNNVVVAHELLHTLGAMDKYDPRTNQPIYPDGYAEPERVPVLPQRKAEIMAGKIPRSEIDAETPDDLSRAIIGALTAREINWSK